MTTADPPPGAAEDPRTAPRWRNLLRTRTMVFVLLLEGLLALAVAFGLWALRQQALGSELRTLASLSAAMATQADSTLDVADATLRATRDELASGLLSPFYGPDAAHALLQSRVGALPKFRVLAVVDNQGQRVATSRDDSAPTMSVTQRDFFVAARNAPSGSLFVGSPYLSPADGQLAIGVSMDWRDATGTFGGVVVLVADPEFLDGGFKRIAPTPDVSLAIYRQDRELVSDGPGDGSARLLPALSMAQLWADDDPERPRVMTLPDGAARVVAAHRLQRYPLMVVISRDQEAALAEWDEQAGLVGSFAASALLVTFLLMLRNTREQWLRRASEAALATEQQRAVRAFQAAREGHWEWNPISRQTHLSPRMKELLGIGRDAMVTGTAAQGLHTAVHPEDRQLLRDTFAAHEAGRTPIFDCRFRVRHADGLWHHVRSRGHAWRSADGSPLLFSGTAADVTDEVEGLARREQLEAQLERARKLEAMGTLAGGVAHDFNNILAAVIGYGELARDGAPAESKQARQLDQVLQAGQRGKALVARILSFSGGAARAHTVFRIQPVVEEVLQLLAASLPEQVQLRTQLQAADAAISGDPTLVYEAVMNLCHNAIQAMPAGGTLGLQATEETTTAPTLLYDSSLPPGRHMRIAVSDSGAGIAPDVMRRLFEPFFTTKGPQQGTGLGLAVVRGVVADLGGAVDVQSTPGQGACFTLWFPLTDETPESADEPDDSVPMGHGEQVLVVDDETGLVEMAEELLAGLGYEPFGMASSVQALARFRADPTRFDLVLTDQTMPEMTGTELAAALQAVRPGLPVVLASGYGGPQLQSQADAAGVAVLLHKPLARAELARGLARALAQ